jgi:hypothetical protein
VSSAAFRKWKRAHRWGHPDVACTVGLCEEAGIETAQQETHDRRVGPVSWRIVPPTDARDALDLVADGDPAYAGYYEHLAQHPDSWCVIAVAPGTPR